MDKEQIDLENAIDNVYNFFKYGAPISKVHVDELKRIHQRTRSVAFWNYVRKIGGDSFYIAVEEMLK